MNRDSSDVWKAVYDALGEFTKSEHDGQMYTEAVFTWPLSLSPTALYGALAGQWRVFWRGKREEMIAVGAGSIFRSRQLTSCELPWRIYGGIPFYADGDTDASWGGFHGAVFFIPQIEWRFSDKATCSVRYRDGNHGDKRDAVIEILANHLDFNAVPSSISSSIFRACQIVDLPERTHWLSQVEAAKDQFNKGALSKVVLSREKVIRTTAPVAPAWFLERFRNRVEPSYLFAFGTPDGLDFLGRSPERILAWNGRGVKADAIAGTKPRDRDEVLDNKEADQLVSSAKEQMEHRDVSGYVALTLSQFCPAINRAETEGLLKLEHVQHMITSFQGQLHADASALELLQALHPTPAVAGLPKNEAMDYLSRAEGWNRGWFAGSVGWYQKDAGDFAIAIRSALVGSDAVRVFAGAGIVPGSCAEHEWDETEAKMSNFTGLLESTDV